jgi:hypothetical protein
MINSNYKSNEEENIPFGIHPSKDHSHSLAPCAPAFLAGVIGHRKRVPKKEGHQPLYSPPLGHPPRPRPLSGHSRSPSGTRMPSVGRPSTLRWAPIRVSVCPARPLGIEGFSVGPLRRASPSGHSVQLLRRATPSGPPSHSLYKYPLPTMIMFILFFYGDPHGQKY